MKHSEVVNNRNIDFFIGPYQKPIGSASVKPCVNQHIWRNVFLFFSMAC